MMILQSGNFFLNCSGIMYLFVSLDNHESIKIQIVSHLRNNFTACRFCNFESLLQMSAAVRFPTIRTFKQ
jgi:hypothetical protein